MTSSPMNRVVKSTIVEMPIYDQLMSRIQKMDYKIENVKTELGKINSLLRSVDPVLSREIAEWFYALMDHHEKLESNGSFKKVAYGPKIAGTGNIKILTYMIKNIPPILQAILILFIEEITK